MAVLKSGVCIHCGASLPSDAVFCHKCGKPLNPASQSAAQAEPQWEYCNIIQESGGFMGMGYRYYGRVVGPRGTYKVEKASEPHDLVRALLASGWEALPPSGGGPLDHRFRRRVR